MKQIFHLLRLFRPFWGWALLGIFLSLVTTLANIALLTTSAWFITAMGVAGLAGVSMNYFTPAAIIRGAAIIRTAGRYIERLVTHEATFRFLTELRVGVFANYTKAPLEQIERIHSTDLTSRVQYDLEALQGFYVRVLVPLTASVLSALVCIFFLFSFESHLALTITAGIVIAGLFLPGLAYLGVNKNAAGIFTTARCLKQKTVDLRDGLGELSFFNGLKEAQSDFMDRAEKRLHILERDETIAIVTKNAIWLVSQLTFLATLVLAADLMQTQQLSQADFVMITMFSLACFESVAQMAPALMQLPQNKAACERVFAIGSDAQTPPNPLADKTHYCDLTVQKVEFKFHDFQINPIRFDFDLPLGQKLLIKGPSGSGKSTLIDLLVAQRTPKKGDIYLNGHSIKMLSEACLADTFSIAAQQTQIFSGSFLSNLNIGCPDCNLDDIEKVLDICELNSVVKRLPDGVSTYIGEQGYNLSGGQIRRLGVARALLKPSAILILDEPTEGLDTETAQRMMANIMDHLESRSLIVISHHPINEDYFDQTLEF